MGLKSVGLAGYEVHEMEFDSFNNVEAWVDANLQYAWDIGFTPLQWRRTFGEAVNSFLFWRNRRIF